MVCSKCGAQIANSADTFCSICGAPVTQAAAAAPVYTPPPVYQPAPPPTYQPAPHPAYQSAPPPAPVKKKSSMPVVLLSLLIVAIVAAGVWYFVLRDKDTADNGAQSVSSRDTADEDDEESERETDEPPVRESGQSIRLPGVFGGGGKDDSGSEPPSTLPEPSPMPEPSVLPEPEPEPTPPVVTYPPPVFWRAMASNVTESPSGKNYMPDQVLDGRADTAWNVPGANNEWVAIEADTEQYVTGIRILNGYTKYSSEYKTWLYYRNNRPKDITILFSDGAFIEWTLMDVFDEDNYIYQDILFDTPILTSYILIYIDSVYEGDRWEDTCISEIEVY